MFSAGAVAARKDGAEREFDAFYRTSAPRVLGQVYLSTGDLAAAEDAVGEAFARAWQHWSDVSRLDAPEAWVRTVASRVAISNWRKLRNRLTAHHRDADDRRDADRVPGLGPEHIVLLEALRTLPVRQRQAVVLHYLAGRTVAEIALEMNAADGTVKSWLSRARTSLRAQLEDIPPADAVHPH
jgi:RNA polymerase sigma-70 factor, ECF subfamily